MAVYQVAIIFEAIDDEDATSFAKHINDLGAEYQESAVINAPKIAFTKFEKGDENEEV